MLSCVLMQADNQGWRHSRVLVHQRDEFRQTSCSVHLPVVIVLQRACTYLQSSSCSVRARASSHRLVACMHVPAVIVLQSACTCLQSSSCSVRARACSHRHAACVHVLAVIILQHACTCVHAVIVMQRGCMCSHRSRDINIFFSLAGMLRKKHLSKKLQKSLVNKKIVASDFLSRYHNIIMINIIICVEFEFTTRQKAFHI